MKRWKIAFLFVVLVGLLSGCASRSTPASATHVSGRLPNTGGMASEVDQFSCGAGDGVHTFTVYGNSKGHGSSDVWQANGYCYIVVPLVLNTNLPVTVGAPGESGSYVAVAYFQVPSVSAVDNRVVFFGPAEYHPAEASLYPGSGWSSGLAVEFVPVKGQQQAPMSATLALRMLDKYVDPDARVWAFSDTSISGAMVCTQLSQALAAK